MSEEGEVRKGKSHTRNISVNSIASYTSILESESSKIQLETDPHSVIYGQYVPGKYCQSSLELKNNESYQIAFKMKTTNPKVITVTPTSGVIHPNKTEKLIVEYCLPHNLTQDQLARDKLLIQTVAYVQREDCKTVADFWKQTELENKTEIGEKKIRCKFEQSESPSNEKPQGFDQQTNPNTNGYAQENEEDFGKEEEDDHESSTQQRKKKGLLKRVTMKMTRTMSYSSDKSSNEHSEEKEKPIVKPSVKQIKTLQNDEFSEKDQLKDEEDQKAQEMKILKRLDSKERKESSEQRKQKYLQDLKVYDEKLTRIESQILLIQTDIKQLKESQTNTSSKSKSEKILMHPLFILVLVILGFVLGTQCSFESLL